MPRTSQPWISNELNQFANDALAQLPLADSNALIERIENLAKENKNIHERECINLNPATNIMNPRAELLLSSGLGTRPSLGHPGDKYEMGLEAMEKIELAAQQLACEVFSCDFAEIRVASGALANLYSFMATCTANDHIIVPPPSIGGHVTHDVPGAAGLYGLNVHYAEVSPDRYSVDIDALRSQAKELKPKLITIGGSLNLLSHPVSTIREIADSVGAYVLFDAAHQCGMIAGKHWPNPLNEGAHLMTMSTYKSLGGPPSGLIVSNDAALMGKIDEIAFPGLTANFDAAKSAALAITMLDWRDFGSAYATEMVATSKALSLALEAEGVPVFKLDDQKIGSGDSHQFAILAHNFGGGQKMAKQLRKANILSCGIGLPTDPVKGDMNGLRLGTPEIVRSGMKVEHMPQIASFIADTLFDRRATSEIAKDVSALRQTFTEVHFVHA